MCSKLDVVQMTKSLFGLLTRRKLFENAIEVLFNLTMQNLA